ncbi:PilW family protein [Glaciecola sp. 2405UD65-10]|jgi:type IV pilus assembly protein PilW|uniref:PilW family protein n=1 Tax=Glaciecola sp. 2405UD65-10 TaxID=3397244 RepID=UPI003B58D23C
MTSRHSQKGFTLIEVMISLALGLIISAAIIQIMVSNSVTERLNRAVASTQESGRYIIARMRDELLQVGLYDRLNPNLSDAVDVVEEESFVRNHPVPIPGDFAARLELGAAQGADGANDILVISLQSDRDCRGYKLGYGADEEFYVVNEYFVSGTSLKCRGFDGRFLRNQKVAVGHNAHSAFTLLDDVLSFQVSYGTTDTTINGTQALPTQYIDASGLEGAYNAGKQVVSIRVAIVVKGEGEIQLDSAAQFKLLGEDVITAPDKGLYKAFETTVTLRNMKNFARGRT